MRSQHVLIIDVKNLHHNPEAARILNQFLMSQLSKNVENIIKKFNESYTKLTRLLLDAQKIPNANDLIDDIRDVLYKYEKRIGRPTLDKLHDINQSLYVKQTIDELEEKYRQMTATPGPPHPARLFTPGNAAAASPSQNPAKKIG